MIRTYSDLIKHSTIEDRFEYLKLKGVLGEPTFGFDRYINQRFYTSYQWRTLRHHIIARDLGCDLAVEGFEIFDRPIIHHMNAISAETIMDDDASILDPEVLITTCVRTHNAIHFGDASLLPKQPVERIRGDTKLW
jgi:hypothetical protein